jgi:uncharacterized protein (DUF1697 family)
MPRYVAFLRAINVGGHVVKMERLRALFEESGLLDVETFIASGNVIFTSRSGSTKALEKKIQDRLGNSLGYEVSTFIRTAAEVEAIAGYAPFQDSRVRRAKTFCVGFLAEPLGAEAHKAVAALRSAADDLHVHGREVYWLSTVGQSDSKFSNAVLERTLKTRATFRGLATVVKLATKLRGASRT